MVLSPSSRWRSTLNGPLPPWTLISRCLSPTSTGGEETKKRHGTAHKANNRSSRCVTSWTIHVRQRSDTSELDRRQVSVGSERPKGRGSHSGRPLTPLSTAGRGDGKRATCMWTLFWGCFVAAASGPPMKAAHKGAQCRGRAGI